MDFEIQFQSPENQESAKGKWNMYLVYASHWKVFGNETALFM